MAASTNPPSAPQSAPRAVPYAELHAHSNFSLLDGTSDPEDLVRQAAALNLRALAITDHDSVAGIVRFAAAAQRAALPYIVGAEVTLDAFDTRSHLTLLCQDFTGYANLCRLLTRAYQQSPESNSRGVGSKDNPHITLEDLSTHTTGLIALSGCPQGALSTTLSTTGYDAALRLAARFRDLFGLQHYYVELHRHRLQPDGPRNAGLRAVAKELGLGCVATNDVHYHDSSRALLHHVVTCIRHRTTLEAAGSLLRGNDEYLLKSGAQMAHLFRQEIALAAEERRPELDPLRSTLAIAERCTFRLQDLRYDFPQPTLPRGESAYSFLVRMVEAGKAIFYPHATPEIDARIEHELAIVRQLNLAGYLLVFKEIVDWSHERGILCSIRGSAPASALLYCLGLCPIDPVKHNLLFERFCSPERGEMPDIDLDFAHERREEVIQHVYQKYGREYAAMVCEVNTYRLKSAIRDVAKVLGLSPQQAQRLADQIDWYDPDPRDRLLRDDSPNRVPPLPSPRVPPIKDDDPRISGRLADLLVTLANQLKHSPRHHSIHVGGMVISAQPLANAVPIEPARMPDRTIIPWDKDDITLLAEEFGVQLIKMDLLGLGMLSVVGRCFEHIQHLTGRLLRLHGFEYDPRAFDVLCAADTVGLFQVESRAQQSFLPRLRPRTLGEVAISVGAIRPGPGAARAGEHIVRRRQGREPITYPAPGLEASLAETYGVLLWQEQCIQVATVTAGYTPGQADQLRRAMSHKRSYERMTELCADLVERMLARGYSPQMADNVRAMIVGFAGYGFPRAHAYPFAHVALISATLRLRYPAMYYAAMLNCQPMGFYAPHTLIWDAARHGVRVLPVDVNRSSWECTLEPVQPVQPSPPAPPAAAIPYDGARDPADRQAAVRLGIKEVHGLGPSAQAVIERERAAGPFCSLADFVTRTGFDRETLECLAEVGAFLSLPSGNLDSPERRAGVWATGELAGLNGRSLPGLVEQLAERADLSPMTDWEATQADYRGLGFSPHCHIISFFRPRLERWGALCATGLVDLVHRRIARRPPGRGLQPSARAGGLVICRQRPETAGDLVFMTLEDETGLFNAIVYPPVYERLRRVLRGEPLLAVEGPLKVQDDVIHLVVRRAWPLTRAPSVPSIPSHDFH